MARKKKEPNRVDDLLDELLEDCKSPEDILGEGGLMKQIKKRLVERALAGELNGHLKSEAADETAAPNSRNGSSKKTIQSEEGELELSIPRDRNGSFEPFWCRSISVVSPVSMRRYWPSMPGVTAPATSALSLKNSTGVPKYQLPSSAR